MKPSPISIRAIAFAAMLFTGVANAQPELPQLEGRNDPATVDGYVGAALDEISMLRRLMAVYGGDETQLEGFDKSSAYIYSRGQAMQSPSAHPLSRIFAAYNIAERVADRRDEVLSVFYAKRGHLCIASVETARSDGTDEHPEVVYKAEPRTSAQDAGKYCREYPDWESARRVTSSSLEAVREITGSTVGNTSL